MCVDYSGWQNLLFVANKVGKQTKFDFFKNLCYNYYTIVREMRLKSTTLRYADIAEQE